VLTHVTGMFAGFAMFGNALITSIILQAPQGSSYGFGFDLADMSLVFMLGAVVMAVSATIGARVLNLWGARVAIVVGAVVTVASYLGRIVTEPDLWLVLTCFCATYVGTAIGLAALAVLAIDAAPADRLTEVLGVQQVIRLTGQSTSSALIGASAGWFGVTIAGVQYASWTAIVVACVFTACASALSIVAVRASGRASAHTTNK
jgi:MFS family permease